MNVMSTEIDPGPAKSLPDVAALQIRTLGRCEKPSPVGESDDYFIDDRDRVLAGSGITQIEPYLKTGEAPPTFEPAGPRSRIFFDPVDLTCGILTCGGLCPGLNNVVRAIVMQLHYGYGVRRILGFRYGYLGLASASSVPPMELTPDVVESAHEQGGTILGSSRGPQDLGEMVENLQRHGVSILFVIGGDGGLSGASALAGEITRRSLPIAVIGVPKTIDNDLQWTWRTFGYSTAVEAAKQVVLAAHAEASGAWNGVGLVKLMGRDSGFIAAGATLASNDVNFCLVPEVPFTLEGEGGFLDVLEKRLDNKRHAVVAVAEGAGQHSMGRDGEPVRDASGNIKRQDIGVFLRDRITAYFAGRGKPVTVRYIDPSYTIRSLPTNAFDSQLCVVLGQYAVHAGMAGRTDMFVGWWNQRGTHVPIPLGVSTRKKIDPASEIWRRVLESTGQPVSMIGRSSQEV
jgi:6-phosphofructokinase 1